MSGAAFTAIVNSLVNDIIMPPIGLLLGGIDFTNFFITLKGTSQVTLKATQDSRAVVSYGQFINSVIKIPDRRGGGFHPDQAGELVRAKEEGCTGTPAAAQPRG